MTINAYNAGDDRTNEFPEYEERHGEDPARFLESNELMATARIRGIRDPDLLAAYEDVADQITAGQYRTTILETIDDRKAAFDLESDELADEPMLDTSADPTPTAATDGGTELSYSEGETETTKPQTPVEPDTLHPDARGLDVGEVLVLEFSNATEHAWPQTDAADNPFILRTVDGDRTLTQPELFDYIQPAETDRRDAMAIDEPAPATAATNGGAE